MLLLRLRNELEPFLAFVLVAVHRLQLLERPAPAVLVLPPREPREVCTALRRALLASDEDTHAEDVGGELADDGIRGGAAADDETLERRCMLREDRGNAGADREELGFEDRPGVDIVRDGGFIERAFVLVEIERTLDVRRDDLGEREVEPKQAFVACRCGLDELVEFLPAPLGMSIPDLLAGESAVLVAEHGDVSIRRGGMREQVRRGETLWWFGRGRDAHKEGRRRPE